MGSHNHIASLPPVEPVEVRAVSEPQSEPPRKRATHRKALPVASDAKACENDYEAVLDESALPESEERSDSEPVTPPAAPVATSAPEPAQQANVEAASQHAAVPKGLFSPVLRRLGFVPGKLYGALMPLAHDNGRVVLFGCLRGLMTLANAQMVLRAHVSHCGCGSEPQARSSRTSFAQYLAARAEEQVLRHCVGSTHQRDIPVAAHHAFKKNPSNAQL